VDPIAREYPWYTPYQFAGNKPIRFIDRDGAEEEDPDKYYRNSLPVITNNATNSPLRSTNPNDYETRMNTHRRALELAQNNENDEEFLGARAMRRYLEGFGGYDIYSYNSMVGEENFDETMARTNKNIEGAVFDRIKTLGPGIHNFTVDARGDYIQGVNTGLEDYAEDFWWAFGGFDIMASADISVTIQEGHNPVITGKAYYTFRDNYVWDVNRGGGYDLIGTLNRIPSHPEFERLRGLGANFFSVRGYFSGNFSAVNNSWLDSARGLGKQKLSFTGMDDASPHIPEASDRRQLIDNRGLQYSYNRFISGTRTNTARE
jgi:hypothetical protein